MLPEKLHDVLSYEGVVSLTTWTPEGPHVNNTWNTYIVEKMMIDCLFRLPV